jgi:hypothetical protein
LKFRRDVSALDICDYALYTGSANLLSLAGSVGAAGAIVAMANAEPEGCVKAFAGDLTAQAELASMHRASINGFPQSLKALGTCLTAHRGKSLQLGITTNFVNGSVIVQIDRMPALK